jgi:hypothetical protein
VVFGHPGLDALSVLAGSSIVLSQVHAQGRPSPLAKGLAKDFAPETATVNGTSLPNVPFPLVADSVAEVC